MSSILITGAAGFIGHHVVQHLLETTDHSIVIIDRLDCSGNLNRLAEIGCHDHYSDRVRFLYHDLRAAFSDLLIHQIGPVDTVLHLAAGTHVDRSIADPMAFVMDNVVATCHLLNFARDAQVSRFLYFSTDEVFGPAPEKTAYHEWDRYRSGNPYAATKAGAEELCLAYHNTYGLPVIITHTMNVYGQRQHPEKFIPNTIAKIDAGDTVIIHANRDLTKAGSRFYIHAQDVAQAVQFVLKNGTPGDKYNIVGECEVDNLSLARCIAEAMDKPLHYEMVDFHSQRPGHDLRYALSGAKLEAMGWTPSTDFVTRLTQTVHWTLCHRQWLGHAG